MIKTVSTVILKLSDGKDGKYRNLKALFYYLQAFTSVFNPGLPKRENPFLLFLQPENLDSLVFFYLGYYKCYVFS